MNVNNNMNNRLNVNFNGALKLKTNEAEKLLVKIDSKWIFGRQYLHKINGDVTDIYFANPRVEKYSMLYLRDLCANHFMHWDKTVLSAKEFNKFTNMKMSNSVSDSKILGAVKLPISDELKGLAKALARRTKGGRIDRRLLTFTPDRKAVSIPLINPEFKEYVLKYLQGSKNPDYILLDKPLLKEEFTDFAHSQVYG